MFYRHNRHYKIFCVNGNTGFKFESRIFYFIHLQNEENFMKEKNQVVPDHIRPKIYPYPPKKKSQCFK